MSKLIALAAVVGAVLIPAAANAATATKFPASWSPRRPPATRSSSPRPWEGDDGSRHRSPAARRRPSVADLGDGNEARRRLAPRDPRHARRHCAPARTSASRCSRRTERSCSSPAGAARSPSGSNRRDASQAPQHGAARSPATGSRPTCTSRTAASSDDRVQTTGTSGAHRLLGEGHRDGLDLAHGRRRRRLDRGRDPRRRQPSRRSSRSEARWRSSHRSPARRSRSSRSRSTETEPRAVTTAVPRRRRLGRPRPRVRHVSRRRLDHDPARPQREPGDVRDPRRLHAAGGLAAGSKVEARGEVVRQRPHAHAARAADRRRRLGEVETEGTVTALDSGSITIQPAEDGTPLTFAIPDGFTLPDGSRSAPSSRRRAKW